MSNAGKSNLLRQWYNNGAYWTDLAGRYLNAHACRANDPVIVEQVDAYRQYSLVKMVFESNRMEEAGLPMGETQRIISEVCPAIPDDPCAFREDRENLDPMMRAVFFNIRKLASEFAEHGIRFPVDKSPVEFSGNKRKYAEVVQHYKALMAANSLALRGLLIKHNPDLSNDFFQNIEGYLREMETSNTSEPETPSENYALINEYDLKMLHRILAKGLLPANCRVESGEYRVENVFISGEDVHFPAPGLIEPSIKRFIDRANSVFLSDKMPWVIAADISYDFVMIHPFPDFNGRMSRILLAMCLLGNWVPFFLTLKSDAKSRQRYKASLRRADQGKMDYYSTLIAMRLVESFREIDAILIRAGFEPLVAEADLEPVSDGV